MQVIQIKDLCRERRQIGSSQNFLYKLVTSSPTYVDVSQVNACSESGDSDIVLLVKISE
jgi:hypothetical protein